jgi:hypothetical protein
MVTQMVIYRLRMYVGSENASAYSASYVNQIGLPIVLPVTLGMLLSVFLIWFRPAGIPSWMPWASAWINAAMIVLARIYIRLRLEAERGGFSESAPDSLESCSSVYDRRILVSLDTFKSKAGDSRKVFLPEAFPIKPSGHTFGTDPMRYSNGQARALGPFCM